MSDLDKKGLVDEITQKKNLDRRKLLNDGLKDVEKLEELDLAIDFDEALKEYSSKNKSHKIKFKGRVFNIPFTMPFTFGMFYMRNCLVRRDGGVFFEIPTDLMAEFIDKMFGKEFLEMLNMEQDVELNFIVGVLVPQIMELWGHAVNTDIKEKNV